MRSESAIPSESLISLHNVSRLELVFSLLSQVDAIIHVQLRESLKTTRFLQPLPGEFPHGLQHTKPYLAFTRLHDGNKTLLSQGDDPLR